MTQFAARFRAQRGLPSDRKRESSSGRNPSSRKRELDRLLGRRTIEWALIATCLAIPTLFLGGLHPLGRLIYLTLVATLALYQMVAFPQRAGTSTGTGALWICAVGAVVLQIVPLPPGLLDVFGSGYRELLPAWNEESPFGRWSRISLAPHAGLLGLGTLLAHGLFFMSVASALREEADLRRALRLAACLGLGMAALALAQYALGNGKYLWLYDHPTRDAQDTAKIPFTSGNHLAHYLALCAGPTVWLLVSAVNDWPATIGRAPRSSRPDFVGKSRPAEVILGSIACVVAVATVLSTFSRGGAFVFLLATAIAVGWYAWRGTLSGKLALGVGSVVAAAALLATLCGGDRLARELDVDQLAAWERLDPGLVRTRLWLADLEAWKRFPLFGSGVGTHREIYPAFFAYWTPTEYRFAESGYVHLLVETGALGAALAIAAIGLVARRLASAYPRRTAGASQRVVSRRSAPRSMTGRGSDLVWGALVASFVVSIVHNVVDFAWFVPGCFSLTLLLAAATCRASALQRATGPGEEFDAEQGARSTNAFRAPRPLLAGLGALALVWIGITVVLPEVRGARGWDEYVRVAHRVGSRSVSGGAADVASSEESDRMIRALQERLRQTPKDHRANVTIAGLCLRRFESEQLASDNAFSLADLRQTLEGSAFKNEESKRAWLKRALGERQKLLEAAAIYARRAIAAAPLDGEAYVCFAAAAPLSSLEASSSQALLDQALASRPFDGTTLLYAAEFAARNGDDAASIRYFRTAYGVVPPTRSRIVNLLGPTVPPERLLDEVGLGKSVEGCRHLTEYYLAQDRVAEASLAADRWFKAISAMDASDVDSPLRSWTALADVYEQLGSIERAAEALERAVALAPNEYVLRRRLAYALLAAGQYDRADAELTRCLRMRPDDQHVQRQRKLCYQRRMAAARETAAASLPFAPGR